MNDRKSIRRNSPGQYPRVLTIAGSDSGGGAGIQADLKTFAANGCYGMSVITALTAQNTRGVFGIHPVPAEFVKEQIDAVMQDIGADAVKIGMLFSAELIRTVAERLRIYNVSKIVLDPVMVAQSGDRLLQAEAIDAIKSELLPLALVVTPNLPEAEIFDSILEEDEGCTYIYDHDVPIFSSGNEELADEARREARASFEQTALGNGILERAQLRAQEEVARLLLLAGYEQVEFTGAGEEILSPGE